MSYYPWCEEAYITLYKHEDSESWYAQCEELSDDISAPGKTPADALRNLADAIEVREWENA